MVEEYEITASTLIISSLDDKTVIYDLDGKHLINMSTKKLIDENCKNYGSSFNGRKEGTKSLTGIKYKQPIIISELNRLIFFPTASNRTTDCSWISLNNIKKYYKNKKKTIIIFNNDLKIELDVSFYIIANQILKATYLESKLYKNNIKNR